MRRITTIGVIAAALLIPAKVSAYHTLGSAPERAVKREIRFDYGDNIEVDYVSCYRSSTRRWSCTIRYYERGVAGAFEGSARVRKSGRRYIVDYRLYGTRS